MEDCNAMHLCWTISPLHRQKLMLASGMGFATQNTITGLEITKRNYLSAGNVR